MQNRAVLVGHKPGIARASGRHLGLLLGLSLWFALLLGATARADVYWSNFQDAFNEGTESFIGHARLDGSEANADFLPVGLTHPNRMASNGEYIYAAFLTKTGGGIGRARLDGSETDPYFITAPGPAPLPDGVDGIAVTSQYIYWTDRPDSVNEAPSEIGRARIDGSEIIPDFITIPNEEASGHRALDLAVSGEYLYYSEIGEIGRVKVTGAEDNPDFIKPSEVSTIGYAWGIAANSQDVYWTNGTGKIGEAENTPEGASSIPNS